MFFDFIDEVMAKFVFWKPLKTFGILLEAFDPHVARTQNVQKLSVLAVSRTKGIKNDSHIVNSTYTHSIYMSLIHHHILGVQLCFRCFFSEIRGFIVKNWLYIYDSKYCPSLATTFSHLSGSIRIPRRKNWSSFEAIHESIQFFTSS